MQWFRRQTTAVQFLGPKELIGKVRNNDRGNTGAENGLSRTRPAMMDDSGTAWKDGGKGEL
jgi:hypothetical protein